MSDPTPLIVPVAVQAWVLNRQTIVAYPPTQDSTRGRMDYGKLANLGDPRPGPFTGDQAGFLDNTANHGVYLLWTLPAGLRHGQQRGDGSITFPLVPNRWLVIRLLRPTGAAVTEPPQLTAWVVQSDALGQPDGVASLDPHAHTATPTTLGHRVEISDASPWQEPAPSGPYFLRAVGEGNLEFAAYQPFNENVFSIHDPLVEEGVLGGTLSYQVIGWYSDQSADVLAGWVGGQQGNDWLDALDALGWSAPDGAQTHTSIYQGLAPSLPWEPQGSADPPIERAMQVALGNTSADAVVAYGRSAVRHDPLPDVTPEQAGELLEAFQYNLLHMLGRPGAQNAIEDRVRANWFASSDGGTTWTIVDTAAPAGAPPPDPPSQQAIQQELAAEAAWLPALNAAQAAYDANVRALAGSRRRLLELWWKSQMAPLIQAQTGALPWGIASVSQLSNAVSAEAQTASGLIAALAAALATHAIPSPGRGQTLQEAAAAFAAGKGLPAWRTLKPAAQQPFFAPADPVMVVSGTQSAMTIESGGKLACRSAAQLTTEITLDAGGDPDHTFSISSSQLQASLPAAAWHNLPPLVPALYAELFLLDPANAALDAAIAGQDLTPDQIQTVAASVANPKPVNSQSETPPALAPAWPWTQPWRPVYIDWSVQWLPIPFTQLGGQPNWVFDGLDYQTAPKAVAGQTTSLSGRALLTPKPGFEFRSRLEQFVTDNRASPATKQLGELDQAIATVDKWDFLSQAFSGLTTQIARWDPIPAEKPSSAAAGGDSAASIATLLGDSLHSLPQNLLAGSTDPRHHTPPSTSTFEGLRAGQLYFNRLTIVDAFGQTLDIVSQQASETFQPIAADGLQPQHPVLKTDPQRLAQLPPRLLQPARLNLAFAPAGSGTPILGWVLPNHLDLGLSVYGADGVAYGELSPATRPAGAPFVDWTPAYNGPYQDQELSDLLAAQPQFGGFLKALKDAGTASFSAFLEAIDETLWTVDPLGARSDAFLSVLLGRPLAVVSASISLELRSQAYRDPSWPFTFSPPSQIPPVVGYEFPVRLGDLGFRQDGLLGYFLDGDYRHFNAVTAPTADPYLKPVGPGNYVGLQFAAEGAGPARALTLLIDPRAGVHAASGILPTTVATLDPAWVSGSLKAMQAAFRTGPVIAPAGVDQAGVTRLLIPSPAERHGTWAWTEAGQPGKPSRSVPLGATDCAAGFPPDPPGLREGFLSLSGGLDD